MLSHREWPQRGIVEQALRGVGQRGQLRRLLCSGMFNTFTAGWQQAVTFTPDGGGSATLPVKTAGWEESVAALDTTNTTSSGIESCIRGILRGGTTITAIFDNVSIPVDGTRLIRAGTKGTLTVTVGTTNPWSVHVLITKVGTPWEMDGSVMCNFDVKLDSTTGSYTRPS